MNAASTASAESWKERLAERFDARAEQLIPALQYVQQSAGYLPREAMSAVADHLKVSRSKVFGVASFYSLFHMKPRGRHEITVCRGTACHVRGSARLLDDLEAMLGIRSGGTTPDMSFTLETVACLGSCALAPVVVQDKVYGRQTSASVRRLVERLRGSTGSTPAGRRASGATAVRTGKKTNRRARTARRRS